MTIVSRSRWAAIGAAVAVTLGAGGIGISHATTDSGDGPVSAFFPIEPCRLASNETILADSSITLDGWGMTGDCDLPNDITGLAANVTAVGATAQTNLRFFAEGAEVPETANLNPSPGAAPTPNAVNITLNDTNGQFEVYNRFGTVSVFIDIMGYYDDHTHDDRYYTEAEVDTALGNKANTADVYTEAEVDAMLPRLAFSSAPVFPTLSNDEVLTTVTIDVPSTQIVYLTADASMITNSAQATACSSATFCYLGIEIWDDDTDTMLTPQNGGGYRALDNSDTQTTAISVAVTVSPGTHTYRLQTNFISVVDDQFQLNNAQLTAMTFPRDGTGAVPTAAPSDVERPVSNVLTE